MRLYSTGDRVSQPQYGAGTVTVANDIHTTIDFDEHGPRTFSTPLVKLERSTTLAPVRAKATRRKAASKAAPKAARVATA